MGSLIAASCRYWRTPFVVLFAIAACGIVASASAAQPVVGPVSPAEGLRAIQDQINVRELALIAMLDNKSWRYSTVDSWARKSIQAIYGPRAFHDLDPVVAAIELMFNAQAYRSEPVLYVKDLGVLRDLTKHPIQLSDEQRKQIYHDKRVSYDFLMSPAVSQRLEELSGEVLKSRAMGRLGTAKYNFEQLSQLFTVVPCPNGAKETPWVAMPALVKDSEREAAGISAEQAQAVFEAYRGLGRAWLARDVDGINAGIDRFAKILPTLAPAGVYPPIENRQAELQYRRLDLLKYSWGVYIAAMFIAIFAVATRYRWARNFGLFLLITAVALHGYDLWLRWGVVGRVPVANMYEAIVSSAWTASMLALVLELFTRKRVYLLASAFLGFFSLSLPELLPDQINNNIQTMMPILDDIMLRIHTVLIITSYGIITLAYVAANCYLFLSAYRDRSTAARATIGAQLGALACLVLAYRGVFELPSGVASGALSLIGVSDESAILACQFIGAMVLSTVGTAMLSVGVFGWLGAKKEGLAINMTAPASDFPVARDMLDEFDLSQRVLIYIATVALFVGIVLGAMWADYSWGRPWGWDPKEVFALNTWLVFAILIHVRFVTKRRALWTSILCVAGFAAMQFNWWVVNFYIVGLHSYA